MDKSKKVIVSDHAFVRFFSRVLGYDLTEVEGWMVPKNVASQILKFGDGVYLCEKYKLVVKDHTIVTILRLDQSLYNYKNVSTIKSKTFGLKKPRKDTSDELLTEYYEEQINEHEDSKSKD